jgi:two-component system, NtrC family, response regulator HydG
MESLGKVLVVESDAGGRGWLIHRLVSQGYSAFGVDSADRAIGYIGEDVDVVLFDLQCDGAVRLDLLKLWKNQSPRTRFIVLGPPGAVREGVEAIKAGADDYLARPLTPEEVLCVTRRAVDELRQERETDRIGEEVISRFIGQSKVMKEVFARITRAASVDSTVMVLGETGTGKERVAHALHVNSARSKSPFVAVNVAAVPATLVESELFGHVRGAFTGATERRIGRFEQASGGTLFIDEIGDFDLALQPKLLRVLETHTVTPVGGHEEVKVDVRVVVATSRNLTQMVSDGKFREDLYYRLNVVQVTLPPLRERTDDIPLLVNYFLHEIGARQHRPEWRFSTELMRRLMVYRWPGNVRQLQNALESMTVLADGDELTERDLPESIAAATRDVQTARLAPPSATMEDIERMAIVTALAEFKNNRTRAAAHLGISLRTLQRKLRLYELQRLAEEGKKSSR